MLRVVSRGVVLGFMVTVLLTMTGGGQATAEAGVCVSVRDDTKVNTEERSDCRSEITSLTIGVTTTGPLDSPFLQRSDVVNDSTRVTHDEDGLQGIALDPNFEE